MTNARVLSLCTVCLLLLAATRRALGSVGRREDDPQPWQVVVQNLSQQLAALTAKVQALENAPPKTITFFAQFTEYHHSFGHDNALLRFDNVLTNIGNAYHTETGRFVAPEAGTYAFFLNLLSDHANDPNWQNVCIMHNEGCVALTQLNDAATLSVVLQLQAGDYVWAMKRDGPGASIYGINHTTFSGMLVAPAS